MSDVKINLQNKEFIYANEKSISVNIVGIIVSKTKYEYVVETFYPWHTIKSIVGYEAGVLKTLGMPDV